MFLPFQVENEEALDGHPVTVWTLCGLNIAVHLVLYCVLDNVMRQNIFYDYGCLPADFRPISLLCCAFLHGGWMHLIGNLLFLYIYGVTLERKLGYRQFLILYLAGALLSSLIHLGSVTPLYRDIPAIGASGAISAVLGAFLIIFPTVKIRVLLTAFVRPIPMSVPAWVVLGFWFIGQLLSSLQITGSNTGIAFWAHIGGFAVGAVYGSVHQFLQTRQLDRFTARCLSALTAVGQQRLYGESAAWPLDRADESILRLHGRFDAAFLKAFFAEPEDELRRGMLAEYREARRRLDYPRAAAALGRVAAVCGCEAFDFDLARGAAVSAYKSHTGRLALCFNTIMLLHFGEYPGRERFFRQLASSLLKLRRPDLAEAVLQLRHEMFPHLAALEAEEEEE